MVVYPNISQFVIPFFPSVDFSQFDCSLGVIAFPDLDFDTGGDGVHGVKLIHVGLLRPSEGEIVKYCRSVDPRNVAPKSSFILVSTLSLFVMENSLTIRWVS